MSPKRRQGETMKKIVTIFAASAVGLAVLAATATVSQALPPKFQAGKTYCMCSCRGGGGYKDLFWEKVAHCSLNGRRCSYTDPIGGKQSGKLDSCGVCTQAASGTWNCAPAAGGPPAGGAVLDPGAGATGGSKGGATTGGFGTRLQKGGTASPSP